MANSTIKIIKTEADFQKLIRTGEKPVIVDFWAAWCGPCRKMAPTLDQIADEREDIIVAKVDVDTLADLASSFNVASIPTILMFKDGQLNLTRIIGAVSKSHLDQEIDRLVK